MIDLSFLEGRHIAVMGLGRTGEKTIEALLKSGAKVSAWDDQEESRHASKHQDVLTPLLALDFDDVYALILSPGIPHALPKPHPVAQRALDAVVPIYCDIELLARAQPDMDYAVITGTNGKSTTTALIGHILNADRKTEIGGNLGRPVLDFRSRGYKSYVLEASSYQLERCPSLRPDVAVWLNITPDHLDRHGDMEGYVNAKKNIFRIDIPEDGENAEAKPIAVIGVDDEYSLKVANELEEEGLWDVRRISVHQKLKRGYYIEEGVLYSHGLNEAESDPQACFEVGRHRYLKGVHNWQNMMAAWACCEAMDVPKEVLEEQISAFTGLAHRQNVVSIIGGIPYVNDSKATNAQAASMALRSYDNIYWILGGQSKEGGLDGLEDYVGRVQHAFLIGAAQHEFAIWLEERGVAYTLCEKMDVAVEKAHDLAQSRRGAPGGSGVVLLSPACASFDQFESYEHRGDAFSMLVQALAKEAA